MPFKYKFQCLDYIILLFLSTIIWIIIMIIAICRMQSYISYSDYWHSIGTDEQDVISSNAKKYVDENPLHR